MKTLAEKKKELESALELVIKTFGKDNSAVRVIMAEIDLLDSVMKSPGYVGG